MYLYVYKYTCMCTSPLSIYTLACVTLQIVESHAPRTIVIVCVLKFGSGSASRILTATQILKITQICSKLAVLKLGATNKTPTFRNGEPHSLTHARMCETD